MSTENKNVVFPVISGDLQVLKTSKNCCKGAAIVRYALKMSVVVFIFVVAEILYLRFASKLVQQNGFYCNDQSIRHPFVKSFLTMKHVFYSCLISPFFIILITEAIRLYRNNDPEFYAQNEDGSSRKTRLFIRVCLFYSYFFAAVTFDLIAFFFCKFWFGRLRPHFIEVCKPDIGYEGCDQNIYITDYSGHSSLLATTAAFLCIYLQNRLSGQIKSQCIIPFIHLLLISVTLWTGYSRVADFKHHLSDVFAGYLVGLFIAGVCTCCAGLNTIPTFARWRKSSFDHVIKIQPTNLV